MNKPLLQVKDLQTEFSTSRGVVRAVNKVSFEIARGEALALVGESGSGKSVTAFSLMGLIRKPAGRVVGGQAMFNGVDLIGLSEDGIREIRGNKIAMIFQEPMTSLNPLLTVGEQISESLRLHMGLSRAAATRRSVELLDLVGIGEPAQRVREYPHRMSGGMRQRVMIAIALACQPDLLIADEPTTALDVTIQAQIMRLIADLRREFGMAMLLITHDLGVVAENADRVAVMYAGRIVEQAPVDKIFAHPGHPYTQGLLGAIAQWGDEAQTAAGGARLAEIPGMVPSLSNLPSGCAFADRCAHVQAACRLEVPPLTQRGSAHQVACILAESNTETA
jgi:peptide/nickel transport system ATP-binding protein